MNWDHSETASEISWRLTVISSPLCLCLQTRTFPSEFCIKFRMLFLFLTYCWAPWHLSREPNTKSEIPCLFWNSRVRYHLHHGPSLPTILGQLNPIQNLPLYCFTIDSIRIHNYEIKTKFMRIVGNVVNVVGIGVIIIIIVIIFLNGLVQR
jgi:hypothetical protein